MSVLPELMKSVIVVVILLGVGGLLGCQRAFEPSELSGVYEVQYEYGVERLKLMPDGKYEQLFGASGKPLEVINRGKWSVLRGDFWDGTLLVLHDPLVVDNAFGEMSKMRRSTGVWQLRARRTWTGTMYFVVNEDQGTFFRKL